MRTQVNKNDFSGQNIYVGIDIHLRSWKVTILMDSLFKTTFSQNPCAVTFYNYLVKNFPGATYFSAYEAGFTGYWAHYKLLSYGINSIVVNPADIPTTSKEKVQKEDARDSRKIARSLKNAELVPIWGRLAGKKLVSERLCRHVHRYRMLPSDVPFKHLFFL